VAEPVAFAPPAPHTALTEYAPLVHEEAPATSVYEYAPVVVSTEAWPISTTAPCEFFVVKTTAVFGEDGAGVTVPESVTFAIPEYDD